MQLHFQGHLVEGKPVAGADVAFENFQNQMGRRRVPVEARTPYRVIVPQDLQLLSLFR